MGELFKREVRRDRYDILVNAGLMLILPFVLIVLCLLFKEKMEMVRSYMCSLQEPVSLIFKLKDNVYMSDYGMLLCVYITFANFIFMWNACSNTVYIMNVDEENGSIFYMCNQLYGKCDFARAKYLYSVVHYAVSYAVWYLFMMIFVVISNIGGKAGLFVGVADMTKDMVMGLAVGIMYVSIIFLYVSWSEMREESNYSLFTGMIVAGPVALANLYKVADIIMWTVIKIGREVSFLKEVTKNLELFRKISPLSWMKPFESRSLTEYVIYIFVAVFVAVVAYFIGVKRYGNKTFVL